MLFRTDGGDAPGRRSRAGTTFIRFQPSYVGRRGQRMARREERPTGRCCTRSNVDPRDQPISTSGSPAGASSSLDGGSEWAAPLSAGCAATFLQSRFPEFGPDPHCVRQHPLLPDRLYQQGDHCGVYRLDRPEDAGCASATTCRAMSATSASRSRLHCDPDTTWVFPMDGFRFYFFTSPDGRPGIFYGARRRSLVDPGGEISGCPSGRGSP